MKATSKIRLSNIRTVYWFAFYDMRSPSVRYRAYYPLKFLKQQSGIEYRLVFPGYSLFRITNFIYSCISAIFDNKQRSVIVIQKVRSDFIYSKLLKMLVLISPENTIYDIDDADYLEHKPHTIYFFMKKCAYVMAGSRALAEYCNTFNQHVILNTSPVPGSLFSKNKRNALFTLGWIGDYGGGHKKSLEAQFFSVLPNLKFKVKLILFGIKNEIDRNELTFQFKNIDNVELEMPQLYDWTNEHFIQHVISGFDVGIATLLNEELHKCKSAFKLKQYMNAGVPVISTNLPENNSYITDGVNGILCNTPDAFLNAIKRFHGMSDELYQKMSNEARSTVSCFDLEHYCNTLLSWSLEPVPVQGSLQ